MHHPITKEELNFKNSEELLHFFRCCNPKMLRDVKKQFEDKNEGYFIRGMGRGLRIVKRIIS